MARRGRFCHCLSSTTNSILSSVIHNSRPFKGFRFSLVGPGKVGSSLASWMAASGARLIQAVGRPGSDSACKLARTLGGRAGSLATLVEDQVDLLLLAVPDRCLSEIATDLAGTRFSSVALHTAGSLGAGVLEPLRPHTSVGSLHPLKAFPHPLPEPALVEGTFFALDGDAKAVELGGRLAELWGGKAAVVAQDDRNLYHLAARLAAGGVTTLLSLAAEIVSGIGLPSEAFAGYLSLAEGALHTQSTTDHPALAITGPIARCESETLLRQLRAIDENAPEARAVVTALDLETLRQLDLLEGPSEARQALRTILVSNQTEAARSPLHPKKRSKRASS